MHQKSGTIFSNPPLIAKLAQCPERVRQASPALLLALLLKPLLGTKRVAFSPSWRFLPPSSHKPVEALFLRLFLHVDSRENDQPQLLHEEGTRVQIHENFHSYPCL